MSELGLGNVRKQSHREKKRDRSAVKSGTESVWDAESSHGVLLYRLADYEQV
jgi:hypothetical protein